HHLGETMLLEATQLSALRAGHEARALQAVLVTGRPAIVGAYEPWLRALRNRRARTCHRRQDRHMKWMPKKSHRALPSLGFLPRRPVGGRERVVADPTRRVKIVAKGIVAVVRQAHPAFGERALGAFG